MNTVAKIFGHYCTTAAMDTFIASKGERHPTDLAALKGARMVCASETEEGRQWAEVRIKQAVTEYLLASCVRTSSNSCHSSN